MPTPSHSRHLHARHLRAACALTLAVWVACVGASGCFSARGVEPLDLSVSQQQISNDSERLVKIRQVMQRDLAQLEAARIRFEAVPQKFYRPPFPLDLFKYVAVRCFNEPYDIRAAKGPPVPGDTPEKIGPWSCNPEYAGRLMVELGERVPEHQQVAIEQLRALDRLRQMRAKLLFRLGQLPGVLREMRQLLATRRADLRRMRDAEARRRTDYRGSDWEEMERRFDAFENELSALSQQIESLAELSPSWKPQVDAQILALYAHLTALSAPSVIAAP